MINPTQIVVRFKDTPNTRFYGIDFKKFYEIEKRVDYPFAANYNPEKSYPFVWYYLVRINGYLTAFSSRFIAEQKTIPKRPPTINK